MLLVCHTTECLPLCTCKSKASSSHWDYVLWVNKEVAAQRECVGLSGNCPVLSIVDKCCVTVAKAQLKSNKRVNCFL